MLEKSKKDPLPAKRVQAIQRSQRLEGAPVPHLAKEAVVALAKAAQNVKGRRRQERNKLLIQTLFDGALRISEALQLTPRDLVHTPDGWACRIVGKGGRPAQVALSPSLVAQLQAFAYQWGLGPTDRFFPINRTRAWQIIRQAFADAGIPQPHGVGAVHVLRHSGAIARLQETRNPKAVQDHLRHASAAMTLRYLKTLSQQESLRIQQQVDLDWR